MMIYRALDVVNNNSSNSIGIDKTMEELLSERKIYYYCEYIHSHLTKGNFIKTPWWTSFSKEFNIAYYYSKPVVYRGNNADISFPRKIKIRRSHIAVCIFDSKRMADITKKDSNIVRKYCKGTAYTFGKSNEEVLALGRIDNVVFLDNFQADLIYVLNDKYGVNKYDGMRFEEIINKVISKNDKLSNEIRFTIIEEVIYNLLYKNNLNLYEIIAPVFYSNNVDILCLYGAVLNIVKSIISKALNVIDINIDISEDRILCLLKNKMYDSELNFICINYNRDGCKQYQCDFSILFDIYHIELNEVIKSNILEKNMVYSLTEDIIINTQPNYYTEVEYPLYVYLPKGGKVIIKDYFEFKQNRDFRFSIIPYKVYGLGKYKDDCVIKEVQSESAKVERVFRYKPYGMRNKFKYYNQNIAKFVAEVYIPDSYNKIEEDVFKLEKNRGYNQSDEMIKQHYSDLLFKVFGGKNLELNNETNYFENRRFKYNLYF